jgi:hypothetical protein
MAVVADDPREPGGSGEEPDLFAELRDFLADEDQLLASLGAALDELVASAADNRLDGDGRAQLWRRIESRVDPTR